jgi:hypothetical protein
MSERAFIRAVGYWWQATIAGIAGGWFGWATAGAVFFISFLQQCGFITKISPLAPWWYSPMVNAIAALTLVVVMHVFVTAPWRTWRMFKPLKIKILVGKIDDGFPDPNFEQQFVYLSIKNRCYNTNGIRE